jgi:hypothetical protein
MYYFLPLSLRVFIDGEDIFAYTVGRSGRPRAASGGRAQYLEFSN